MRLPFFKSYVRFCELKKGAIRYFLMAQVRHNERQRRQGGTYVPLKKLICVRVCERKKRGDMTYSEFRYLWNVREVEKDNASRLRDITNVMTRMKSQDFLALSFIMRLKSGLLSLVPVIALSMYVSTMTIPFLCAYSSKTLNCPSMDCSVWLSDEYLA